MVRTELLLGPIHHITTVEYVGFDGYKWDFCPRVYPILFPRSSNISAREFRGHFIKALPKPAIRSCQSLGQIGMGFLRRVASGGRVSWRLRSDYCN
jgi:hypothetical protein